MIGQQLGFGDLNDHSNELLLHHLVGADWLFKNFSFTRVILCYLITGNGRTKGTARDPEAGVVNAL